MGLSVASGGANSDSYCSVVWAESYLLGLYPDGLGDWDSLVKAQKEHRMKLAAMIMGYLPLRGKRAYRNQVLEFPRYIRNEPRALEGKKIPVDVMRAQALIAYGIVHRGLATESSPDEGGAAGRVSSVSLGGLLSVRFSDGPLTGGTILTALIRSQDFPIYALLKPFLLQARLRNRTRHLIEVLYSTTTTISESTTTTTRVITTTSAPITTTTSV